MKSAFHASLLAMVVSLMATDAVRATIVNWNVASGGSWNTPTNWSTSATPSAADVASIGSIVPSGTTAVTLDADQTIYGYISSPGSGKTLQIGSGTPATSKLIVLSTDAASDGSTTFFAFSATNGTTQINAPVQLGNGSSGSFTATFNSFVNASSFVINGALTESPGQTWGVRVVGNGTGIVNYATTAKAYSGDTTIANNGILKLNSSDMIPNGAGKGNLVLEGNGTLQLNSANDTINALVSTSTTSSIVKFGTTSRSLTVGDGNSSGSFAGTISLPGGTTTTVNKIGSGTQTLGGNVSVIGAGTVSGGRLNVNGIWTGNTTNAITVNTGATLGGTGSINGPITLGNATTTGTVSPGMSAGTLTVGGVVTTANSIFAFELSGTDQTVGLSVNDLLVVNGNLTLAGTLNVAEMVAGSFLSATTGSAWRLINYTGTLTNNSIVLGSLPTLQSGLFFSLDTSIANQVNLVINGTAVPEAGAVLFGAVATCLAGASAYRKRRLAGIAS